MPTKKKKESKTPETAETPKTTKLNELVGEEYYTLVLTRDELLSAVQILTFVHGMFEQMVLDSSKKGDEKAMAGWTTRAVQTKLLYLKLRDVASIGEPDSREVH